MDKIIIGENEIALISRSRTTYDIDAVIRAVSACFECSKEAAMRILVEYGCINISDSKVETLFKAKPSRRAEYWSLIKEEHSVKMNEKVYNKPYLAIRKSKVGGKEL